MKIKTRHFDINKAIALCERHGVTVTPVKVGRKFRVKVDDNGEVTVYEKEVYAHRLNSALKKTWRHHAMIIYKKLKNAEQSEA